MELLRDTELTVTIEKYVFGGKGLARVPLLNNSDEREFIIFVYHAYPGDIVRIKITKKKKNFAEAKIIDIVSPSPERITARCVHFGVCGGCKQQDLLYEAQLVYKTIQVKELFSILPENAVPEFMPSVGAKNIFWYRNKMEYTFTRKRWLTNLEIRTENAFAESLYLGLHVPEVYEKVFDLEECHLQIPLGAEIVVATRAFFRECSATVYDTRDHTGYLRNLVIRTGLATNDLMVNLVTSAFDEQIVNQWAAVMQQKFPSITTIVNSINSSKAMIATGESVNIISGTGIIRDRIGDCLFTISPNSFFQTNTQQAEKLYLLIRQLARLEGTEVVYDLFCGAGTITLFLAPYCSYIYGFESSLSAVNDAAINIRENNAVNVKVLQADLYRSFLPLLDEQSLPLPKVIITDPPRSGMHEQTVRDIITINPERIVYISCNPSTQVRDIALLLSHGYALTAICPVDMFPHTFHIENIAVLERQKD